MLVIAHRGASGHAPENTLAAFRKAVAFGATFIETDLQLSRDAHFVAIHDGAVNRTTNGRNLPASAYPRSKKSCNSPRKMTWCFTWK